MGRVGQALTVRGREILFRDEMVRAILAGKKSQTRRVIKPQPSESWMANTDWSRYYKNGKKHLWIAHPEIATREIKCKYAPRDHVWVREAWRVEERKSDLVDGVRYRADDAFLRIENTWTAAEQWVVANDNGRHGTKWRPSIFMPRWASRITLEITDIRVERLQAISEQDAKAEGVPNNHACHWLDDDPGYMHDVYRRNFVRVWDEINGEKYPWASDPYVWAISFRRVNEQ